MRKVLLLFVLLLMSDIGYSQVTYFNYLDYTSEWRYYGGGWTGVNAYEVYETRYFDGYETIDNITYYKEYSNVVETQYNPIFGVTYSTDYIGGPYYVREDNSGKFYRINPGDGTEMLILDNEEILSAQIGDPFPYTGATCNVETIETVTLGTIQLKKIKGVNTGNMTGTVEGIGVIGLACAMGIEGNGGLNCYTKQGITAQFGTIDCSLFPIPTRVDLSTSISTVLQKLFVSPNPTNGIIAVSHLQFKNEIAYNIYNGLGELIASGFLNNVDNEIDISGQSSGIYILQLKADNVEVCKKVVKF